MRPKSTTRFKLMSFSVTIPLRIIHQTLTSPLTISLALKLALLGVLTLASGVFSILAVGAFWYSWGTGGAIEVEGWLRYGRVPPFLYRAAAQFLC